MSQKNPVRFHNPLLCTVLQNVTLPFFLGLLPLLGSQSTGNEYYYLKAKFLFYNLLVPEKLILGRACGTFLPDSLTLLRLFSKLRVAAQNKRKHDFDGEGALFALAVYKGGIFFYYCIDAA